MRLKELTISATISTAQYNNMMPSFTLELAEDDDIEVAKAFAMSHITELSNKYAEPGRAIQNNASVKLRDIFNQTINFDAAAHVYTNDAGQVYLSGSQYAKRFEKPFDADMIAGKMAAKSGVDKQLILDAWRAKADVSAGFGTAIHLALENYHKYSEMAKILNKPYDLHDHPVINKAVKGFYKGREKEVALHEALVVDHQLRLAGTIDRLLLVDKQKKICVVEDFKTSAVLDKDKMLGYQHQLSFYASIIQARGWTVEGLRIHHWNGKWETHELNVLEVNV